MLEIFSFLEIKDLQRMQNLNKRFYSQTLPRIIYQTPLSQTCFAYSFSNIIEEENKLLLKVPDSELAFLYIYSPPNLNKKFRLLSDLLIRSKFIDKSKKVVRYKLLNACKLAN